MSPTLAPADFLEAISRQQHLKRSPAVCWVWEGARNIEGPRWSEFAWQRWERREQHGDSTLGVFSWALTNHCMCVRKPLTAGESSTPKSRRNNSWNSLRPRYGSCSHQSGCKTSQFMEHQVELSEGYLTHEA